MEIYLQNTLSGLVPCTDDDYDKKKKLKIGETYKVVIKLARNHKFHRKYFALIRCAWEFLSEAKQDFFKTQESFRKTVEVTAGHFEMFYLGSEGKWVQIPKSISFESMDNAEFEDLYSRVLDVIIQSFISDRKHFEETLINFMK